MNENVDLAKAVEEANKIVKDVNATNDNLQIKINVMEKDATKYLSEKVNSDSKIKDDKKRHVEEVGKLQEEVKALNKLVKCKDKANYDLNKKLENARESANKFKLEKSVLKTRTSKLETEVKKLDKKLKEKVKTAKVSEPGLSEEIINNNNSVIKKSETLNSIEDKHITVANASASGLSNPMLYQLQPSLVSHWNPNITKSS